MKEQSLANIVTQLESDLRQIYEFKHEFSANEFMLSSQAKVSPQRGAVLLAQDSDTLEIALYYDQEIIDHVEAHDPLERLTDSNLDAFSVVAEELSHFHFIVQRAEQDQPVSKVELERQGEIDKLLLCAIRLRDQVNDPHYLPLARKLFDLSRITSDEPHYWEATRHAARFWYDLITYCDGIDDPLNSKRLKEILQNQYNQSLQEKTNSLPFVA